MIEALRERREEEYPPWWLLSEKMLVDEADTYELRAAAEGCRQFIERNVRAARDELQEMTPYDALRAFWDFRHQSGVENLTISHVDAATRRYSFAFSALETAEQTTAYIDWHVTHDLLTQVLAEWDHQG